MESSATAAELHESPSELALKAQLEARGLVVLSMERLDRPRSFRGGAGLDLGWWCKELRSLLNSGMTVVEAIETLAIQSQDGVRQEVGRGLLARIRQGESLSVAMESVGRFPTVLIAGVRASERTGALTTALDDFLKYHDLLQDLRRKVVSAAIYPLVVIGLGLLIACFLLGFVLPRFAQMYGEHQDRVGWATGLLLSLSRFMTEQRFLAVAMVGGLLIVFVFAWRQGAGRWVAERLLEHVGPLKRQLREFELAKLYHSLSLMFRGGYPLDEAMALCSALGLSAGIQQGVIVGRRELSEGKRVSVAFERGELTDEVTARLLAVGERTGDFHRTLNAIADRHAENFTVFIERAARVVEPVLLMTVAMAVGAIVVLMYMPIFDIASTLR